MIDYIKYTIDGKTYELVKNDDDTWSRNLNAPDVAGRYDLLLEIGSNGIVTYIDSNDPRYTFYLDVIREIERRVDLIKYLPDVLNDVEEFKVMFDSEDLELDKLYDEINNTNSNIFIRTASNERITRIENFLRIKGVGTLEQRKSYLLALFQKDKKMNEELVKEVANTITGSDCIVTFFAADEPNNPYPGHGVLQVQVLSPDNQKDYRYEDIARALKYLNPGHIKLLVIKFFATWEDIKNNFGDWNAIAANMADWQAVKNYIPPQE